MNRVDKYEHLFVKNMPVCGPNDFNNEGEPADLVPPKNLGEPNWLLHADLVPDAKVNMTHIWIHETEVPELWVVPHVHDYDEILIWTGGDPESTAPWGSRAWTVPSGSVRFRLPRTMCQTVRSDVKLARPLARRLATQLARLLATQLTRSNHEQRRTLFG